MVIQLKINQSIGHCPHGCPVTWGFHQVYLHDGDEWSVKIVRLCLLCVQHLDRVSPTRDSKDGLQIETTRLVYVVSLDRDSKDWLQIQTTQLVYGVSLAKDRKYLAQTQTMSFVHKFLEKCSKLCQTQIFDKKPNYRNSCFWKMVLWIWTWRILISKAKSFRSITHHLLLLCIKIIYRLEEVLREFDSIQCCWCHNQL